MMVVLLAVTNCVCGAAVFAVSSLLTSEAWIPVLLIVLVSTLTTVGFAWLVSNDVLRPLDKLNLLAKSIERSPGMSVPNTTGAIETDDLLHTISRASRQLTNFIDLMNDVTAGNTKAALDPLEHSDRLSESFQKLVAKVTDSIDAKAELDSLKRSVNQISSELSGLRRGEPVKVKNDFEGTRTITDALRHLIEEQTSMMQVVGSNSSELKTLVSKGKNRVTSAIDKDAARDRMLKKLSAGVAESSAEAERSMRDLAASLASINDVLAELKKDIVLPEESAKSYSAIRRQFDAAIHKLRDVGEQSLAITHVAKAVQDLAKRSNMIALNTSIQANDENSTGLSTLTQEIASLSERSEKANKAIAGIGDSIVRDVNEANAAIHWITSEVNRMAARAARAEESLSFARENLTPLAELPAKIETDSAQASAKANLNNQLLADCTARSEEVSAELHTCEASFAMLQEPLEAIRASVTSNKQVLNPIGHTPGNGTNGKASKPRFPERDLITLTGEK
jgi:methyl-accepting chemotaxis protein